MTVAADSSFRGWPSIGNTPGVLCLEDKFEVIKDIGDGSFGSVVLARTRGAGAHLVRRNTLVAVKTMKKTFDSFSQCLDLREVIFLKSIPAHPHLVPAYDIFLDPLSKKLHIAMENMDGNLYQLMKTRDHKPFDDTVVKSILFQILGGLEHIHEHNFFHRDIKPENILVSSSAPDTQSSFKRYSSLVTPPSTPPTYTIKLADFGLARETHSMVPYTTYVSTRWYRAPEVLLRAGHYSAPVDIWAFGAMAVEIATLKPLFPGGNEVDQVWRVCEIMGSPGLWVNKHGQKLGGGEWKDGVRLAGKLGFSFPKMAPHPMETILQAPQWSASFARFITWCLMWDPSVRPTSTQALQHEYFADAIDPVRPKSSNAPRFLRSKSSTLASIENSPESSQGSISQKKSSWFRKSLNPNDITPPPEPIAQAPTSRPLPVHAKSTDSASATKLRPPFAKRATWNNVVPIPILPSIKPVSPIHDAVNASATTEATEKKKISRQLSVNSHGNHYAEYHRQEAEKALTGMNGLASPTGSIKESFFSHLRKRARRLSGRNQIPISPGPEEPNSTSVGCAPWVSSNRSSLVVDPPARDSASDSGFSDLDKALESVRNSLDARTSNVPARQVQRMSSTPILKRHHSLSTVATDGRTSPALPVNAPASTNRTRRSVRQSLNPRIRYETPDEEDELLDEALANARRAARRLEKPAPSKPSSGKENARPAPSKPSSGKENARPPLAQVTSDPGYQTYLTPSPSKDSDIGFEQNNKNPTKPVAITSRRPRDSLNPQWPTPPYDDHEWASSAAASILAVQKEGRFN